MKYGPDHERTRVATLNANSLPPVLEAVIQLVNDYDIGVLCLQECYIPIYGRGRIQHYVNNAGLQILFGDDVEIHRGRPAATVAIIYRGYGQRYDTSSFCSDPRLLVLRLFRRGLPDLLIGSIYGHASNRGARDRLVSEAVEGIAMTGRPYIVCGDFNMVAEEDGALARLLANGSCRLLDDDHVDLPRATMQNGRGRIDLGVAATTIWSNERLQIPGPRIGHDCVVYGFDWTTLADFFAAPRRRRFADDDGAISSGEFQRVAAHLGLSDEVTDVDEHWSILSEIAEELVCQDYARGCTPRAQAWTPTRGRAVHRAGEPCTSVRQRQMMRLDRRLKQLQRFPTDERLRDNAYRCARAIPDFKDILKHDIEDLLLPLQARLEEEVQKDKQRAIEQWKEKLRDNVAEQRKWIKRDIAAEQQRRLPPTTGGPLSPMQVINEATEAWSQIWGREHPTGAQDFDLDRQCRRMEHLLDGLPHVRQEEVVWDIHRGAEELRRGAARCKNKAAGPDGWCSRPLLRLPVEWWLHLSKIWHRTLHTGRIPARWVEAKLVLIPKEESAGATRPLSITSLLWRLGATCLLGKMQDWVQKCIPSDLVGGIVGRGLEDAVSRVVHAIGRASVQEETILLTTQDLEKAFDSVGVPQALAIAGKMGMSKHVIQLLADMYARARRIFYFQGCFGSNWHPVRRGLMQGCPFSALVMAIVMSTWRQYVGGPGRFKGGHVIYLDDRTYWVRFSRLQQEEVIQEMRSMQTRADYADSRLGFKLNTGKCQTTCSDDSALDSMVRAGVAYNTLGSTIKILGLVFDAKQPRKVQYSREATLKVDMRLSRIACATSSRIHRALHVRMLVTPLVTWAAGFVQYQDDQEKLRKLASTVHGPQAVGSSTALVRRIVLGWQVDPGMVCIRRVISLIWKHAYRRDHMPEWYDDIDIEFLLAPPMDKFPTLGPTIWALGWQMDDACLELRRVDRCDEEHVIRVGECGLNTAQRWASEELATQDLDREPRIRRPRRRHGEGTSERPIAGGLPCPMPAEGLWMDVSTHVKLYWAATEPRARAVAVGNGCGIWHEAAYLRPEQRRRDHDNELYRCCCGRWDPSGPHVRWACEAMPAPVGLAAPRDSAEETLALRPLRPRPPPRAVPQSELESIRQRCDEVVSATLRGTQPALATDGGASGGVSVWALAANDSGAIGGPVASEDASPHLAELYALDMAVASIARVHEMEKLGCRRVVVIYDCRRAYDVAVSQAPRTLWRVSRRIRDNLQGLSDRGCSVVFQWVPAHDKPTRADWTNNSALSLAELRDLNKRADAEVGRVLRDELQKDVRGAHSQGIEEAKRWQELALSRACQVGKLFGEHVAVTHRRLHAEDEEVNERERPPG